MQSYTKIFNDVFVNEKPALYQKYYLTEVQIVEMNETQNFQRKIRKPVTFNFSRGTSKYVNYSASDLYCQFLAQSLRYVQKHDQKHGNFGNELHKRGRKPQGNQSSMAGEPQNGFEFFFSNNLVKIFQVPMLFTRSSEDTENPDEGCFIILVFEKNSRKRTFAKSQAQFNKLRIHAELRKNNYPRFEEEMSMQRDSKMRRFCNYFVTLFNQRKITPFTQFVNQE